MSSQNANVNQLTWFIEEATVRSFSAGTSSAGLLRCQSTSEAQDSARSAQRAKRLLNEDGTIHPMNILLEHGAAHCFCVYSCAPPSRSLRFGHCTHHATSRFLLQLFSCYAHLVPIPHLPHLLFFCSTQHTLSLSLSLQATLYQLP